MVKDISYFKKSLRDKKSQMYKGAKSAMSATIMAFADTAIRGTPADTGKARSSYQGSAGAPARGDRAPYAPGKHLGIKETRNADAALSQISGALNRWDLNTMKSFYLSNATSYLGLLNAGGHSRQAPNGGFLERASISVKVEAKKHTILRRV